MQTINLILSIVQAILAVFIILVILLQSGKSAGLSGSIAGGAETFLGKNKARTWDAKLSKLTIVVASLFGLITILLNVVK